MHHDLKCLQGFFAVTWMGAKPFEIRKNDRGFQVGDTFTLNEFDHKTQSYTGRKIHASIRHVYGNLPGLDREYVIIIFDQTGREERPPLSFGEDAP